MGVHAGAVDSGQRFGHEGRMEVVKVGHPFNDVPEGDDGVGGSHCRTILEVDLVLSGCDFVVGGLNFEAHRLQHQDHIPAGLLAQIDRAEVEVSTGVMGHQHGIAFLVSMEKEELGFRPRHHLVAHYLGFGHGPLEDRPGAAGEGLSVVGLDVADQAADLAMPVLPGVDLERLQIGGEQHVAFFDAGEALDRRSVEHHFAIESLLELALRDLDILGNPVDVRELQAHEVHIFLCDSIQNILGRN